MPPARQPARPDPTLTTLYQAVLAAPDDDLPRLVYADRLDELGDHARAEFIRLQIHVAKTKPWDEGHADALVKCEVLYERHKEAWGIEELTKELMRSKDVRPGEFKPFVRGFPEVSWAVIESFTAAHRQALNKYPIRQLVLVGGRTAAVSRVGELVHEAGASVVDLRHASGVVFATLAEGPVLTGVRELNLRFDFHSPAVEDVARFADSGNLPNVRVVRLNCGQTDAERLREFLRHLRWPAVREIQLAGLFNDGVMEALTAVAERLPIERLSAEDMRADYAGRRRSADLTTLFRSKQLSHLRSLTLDGFPWTPEAHRAFAASTLGPLDHCAVTGWSEPPLTDFATILSAPALIGVKSLELPMASEGAEAIAERIGHHAELRQLKWGASDFTVATWAALANSPASQTLRQLHLERAPLDAAAVQAVFAGPPWPQLSSLVLPYAQHDGRSVMRLLDHPHFARLVHLDVNRGSNTTALWQALAKSKTVGRFHTLQLGFPITDAELNAILDNREVCKIGHLALPNRVKIDRKTQRRYEKVFGVRITRDW